MTQRSGYGKNSRVENEEESQEAGYLSALLYQWMNSIFKTGAQRPLYQEDFLPLTKDDSAFFLTNKLQAIWNEERDKSEKNGKRPKLWKCLFKMLSVNDLLVIVFGQGLCSTYLLLYPLFLGYLVSSLMSPETEKNPLYYICALGLCFISLVGTFGLHHKGYRSELFGIRISSALRGLVYRTSLLLSKETLQKFTTGHVLDLISNDVKRMENQTFPHFFGLPFNVLEIVVVVPLLGFMIGWQAIVAAIFLLLLVPYFAELSYASAAVRLRTAAVSDRRISLMSQVVAGIRAIKTHAWEDKFQEKIRDIRKREISAIYLKNALQSTVDGLLFSVQAMATLVSVLTMMLTGQTITPVNVFVLLSYVGILRRSTCNEMAIGFLLANDAYVSLGRIEDFLLLDQLPENSEDEHEEDRYDPEISSVKRKENTDLDFSAVEIKDLEKPSPLCVSDLTYKGTDREHKFILQDIEFITPSKSLTVITGPVGSGKSTLLSVIAGEISETSGTITNRAKIVYLPQTAWIFSGTIRENILFGQPYVETKYACVLEACALKKDIQRFPDGDLTVVGERGEVLSGGQQARVSLARAVYADGDLYLLDDPLSAFDSKVGQHIFDKCIKELLRDKTRLLTSHHEQHMKDADEVIVIYKGRLLGKGRFNELQEKGIISSTINPLHKTSLSDNSDLNESLGWDSDSSSVNTGKRGRRAPLFNKGKCLQMSKEDRAVGVVTFKLYWDYFRSGLHPLVIIVVLCFSIITQVVVAGPDLWLPFLIKQTPDEQRDETNLAIYGMLVAACFIFAVVRAYGFLMVCLRCADRLHDKMVVAILQAPVLFFDSNPAGRILNRFSNDIGCADELLPKTFLLAVEILLLMCTAVLIPIVSNPWLLLVAIPLTVLFVYISKYYMKSARELKRLESICRSPVFSHFSETVRGMSTIRTRGRQSDFIDTFYRYQDIHNQSYILVKASGRWLGVRLDLMATCLVCAATVAGALTAQNAAFAGLSFVYAIQSLTWLQYCVRTTSDVENYMTSVERIITYTRLDSEPGYEVKRLPREDWPNEGSITFRDVSLIYYPGGPQVLKNINLSIKGGEKIGVTGRTGAGKSSFVAALLRMPDADGEIMIDNVPINEMNIQEARRCISVLGQNSVLFSGSLRSNLDVLEHYQDADLLQALEDVQLKDFVENLKGQLEHELMENGANVSVGERQLICLARVLLQKSRIIILDEPTAHVDPETEQTIWKVVRDKLKDFTVITIAHRLNTIRDCEKILVFNDGEVDGFDKFESL